MRLYGYEMGKEGELLTLEEVSLAICRDELEDILAFLVEVRELMEEHGTNFGHEHFLHWVERKRRKRHDTAADIVVVGREEGKPGTGFP